MKVDDVKIKLKDNSDTLKAIGSISLDGQFAIKGIKIIANKDGSVFVTMPSRRKNTGGYEDVCFPLTREFHQHIQEVVIDEYNKLLNEKRKGKEVSNNGKCNCK